MADSNSSFGYLNNQQAGMDLPNRQRTGLTPQMVPGTVASLSPSSNDMDTSADTVGMNDQSTPSTTASRHGSSSHTSFTPPSHQDDLSKASFASAFGNLANSTTAAGSLGSISASSAMPLGPTTATTTTDQAFFPVSTEDMEFANMNTNFFPESGVGMGSGTGQTPAPLHTDDFQFPPGWDISMGGTGAGTGLTPIAEPHWNSMMEGWSEMGPSHATNGFGRAV